jgi:cell wall-associated NlpC family hydrolase
VRQVYLEELGIELPEFDTVPYTDHQAIAGAIEKEQEFWVEVKKGQEEAFDGVLSVHATHVGIVVRRGMMLHLPAGLTSVVERYNTPKWEHRIDGFYRASRRIPGA